MFKTLAAIHLKKNKDLKLDEISFSDPEPDEVVIKNIYAGICHSQLINISKDPETPGLLGHEGTAEIVKAGKKVKHVKEGDKVIVSWMPNDFSNQINYLKWSSFFYQKKKYKTLIYNWSHYSKINSQFIHLLPKNNSKRLNSIMGCAVISGYLAVEKIIKKKNFNSLVLGAGGLGLLALNALKNFKPKANIVLDKNSKKLIFAKRFGSTHSINSNLNNFENEVLKITKNEGLDYIFDFTGNKNLQQNSLKLLKKGTPGTANDGGTFVIVGFSYDDITFYPKNILMNNQTIIGMRGGRCIPKNDFLSLFNEIKKNKIKLQELITDEFSLKDINIAIKKFKKNEILGRGIIKL